MSVLAVGKPQFERWRQGTVHRFAVFIGLEMDKGRSVCPRLGSCIPSLAFCVFRPSCAAGWWVDFSARSERWSQPVSLRAYSPGRGRAHCLRACARAGTAARTGSACAGGYRIQQCGRLVPRRSHPRRGPTLRRERCLLPRSQLHVRDAPQNAHGTFAQRAACDCRRSARPYHWPATRKRKCSGAGRGHCRRARANRSRTPFPRRAEARTRRRRAPVFAPCERSGPRPKCASLLGHRLVGATLFPAARFPL